MKKALAMFRMLKVPFIHQLGTASATVLTTTAAIFGTSYFGVLDGDSNTGLAMGMGALLLSTISATTLYLFMPFIQNGVFCFFSCGGFLHPGWNAVSTSFKFGSHMAVLRLMDRYLDEPQDAQETLTILQTMTSGTGTETEPHFRRVFGEMGGIELTVKALHRYAEDDADVACSGCGLLMNLCGCSESNDFVILECGGISSLVKAMQDWPNHEQIQCYGSIALDRLAASGNLHVQKKIIDVGGLVALAEARTKHQNDIRVRPPATHALLQLVQIK